MYIQMFQCMDGIENERVKRERERERVQYETIIKYFYFIIFIKILNIVLMSKYFILKIW